MTSNRSTLHMNELVVDKPPPSVTTMLIQEAPARFAIGVSVTVRFVTEPPKPTPEGGSRSSVAE